MAKSLFKNPKVMLFKKDIREFTSREKYDIVFSSGVLEHFSGDDLKKVLKSHINNAAREAIIVVPAAPSWNNIRCKKTKSKEMYGWWQPLTKKDISFIKGLGH